ncbi:DUF3291 domain-containing protein [Sandarakinorhabdus rubra]|uniref:DUF3291 domain-containing protein n=1 Tax=Sandarakinorhabdus rubra TaxID=2672568 RepID=UPI0013DBFE3D|nr:DUF3291 domain-containing protein [Sandarakinorhabdus rubra]
MSRWQLAQINVARLVAPKGDPRVQSFFDQIEGVNAVADGAEGFVWRMQDDSGNATGINPTPDLTLLVNISVWRDIDCLYDFVYRTVHREPLGQRRDWFVPFEGAFQALWWVPAGHRPSVDEGLGRLWMLDRYGPTAAAFGFKTRFPAPLDGLTVHG